MRIILIRSDGMKAITGVESDKTNVVYMTGELGEITRVFQRVGNATENVEGLQQPLPVFVEVDKGHNNPIPERVQDIIFSN